MNAVLITGASSGIGECFARSCASQGKMCVCDGTFAKLQSIMPKLLSRKQRVAITGKVGKDTWGA